MCFEEYFNLNVLCSSMRKEDLINKLISTGALKTPEIIEAFRKVPREEFVLPELRQDAYKDIPLPILAGQTISQPTTVAIMVEALKPKRDHKVLEIGSGSGYQAAILAELVKEVYTVERIKELVEFSKRNLERCGYHNVKVIWGDGRNGYPEAAPYDGIIVTAAAFIIPTALKEQLKIGGRLVVPVGLPHRCRMLVYEKVGETEFNIEDLGYFSFVPLLSGKAK